MTNDSKSNETASSSEPQDPQGFDLFLARADQLADRFKRLPRVLRFLMLFSVLSALWLWFICFASSALWVQLLTGFMFLGLIVPLFFVYQLYDLSQSILDLPDQLIAMRERLKDQESFQAFAVKEMRQKGNLFNSLAELRAFTQAATSISDASSFLKLRFVKTLNPFFNISTLVSIGICFLVSLIGTVTFLVYGLLSIFYPMS